jgi:3-(3-hydroxy-phenyl)propionate hydroxylase
MLAALLTQRTSLRVIAIDRDTQVYPLPRAAHFDHEIMRLFQQLGIADEVLRHARAAPAYEFRNSKGETLLRYDLESRTSRSGWPQSFMFHQPGMERALRGLLSANPNVELRLGRSFVSLAERDDAVLARLEGPNGNENIRASFVIGCDGASSSVRDAIGVELDSYDFDEPWLVIDTIPGPSSRVPRVNLQICDPERPTTCVLMGPGRHRWEFMLRPGERTEDVLKDDFIRARLAPWDCADIEIDRRAVYRFHGLVAKQWRRGRVLLAGDAAHQMPPFAGQGMCAGLRDAANLAWKVSALLRGADETLLDTYQCEREPHVRATIELAIYMGRVVCTTDPKAAAERDRTMLAARARGEVQPSPPAPPPLARGLILEGTSAAGTLFPQPWSPASGQIVKLDDVLGSDAWLIGRDCECADISTMPVPVRVRPLDHPDLEPFASTLDEWLATQSSNAVLVRPDRYVFGTGHAKALVSAFGAAQTAKESASSDR